MSFKSHVFDFEDQFTLLEGSPEELVKVYEKFEPNESHTKTFTTEVTLPMQRYIDKLYEAGLDIGKGDATFGYKMPLPSKNDISRKLIIFRRK